MTAVAEFRPEVLLCDIAMPGEDGYAFIRRLRALGVDGRRKHPRARADRAGDRGRPPALAGGGVSDAPHQARRHRAPVRGGGRARGASAGESMSMPVVNETTGASEGGSGALDTAALFAIVWEVLARRPDRPAQAGQAGDPRCRMIGRALHDVMQLLESADRADERIRRVLERLNDLVPYQQCALLEARLGYEERVVLVPETSAGERAALTRALVDIFGQLSTRTGASAWSRGGPRRRVSRCRSWGSTR